VPLTSIVAPAPDAVGVTVTDACALGTWTL
jgi:hypothetical protein